MSNSEFRLYVKPISRDVSKGEVSDLFAQHGELVDVRLMDGYGFVEFAKAEDATKAVDELNNFELNGDSLIVTFARLPRERDDRRRDRDDRDDRRRDRDDRERRDPPQEIVLHRISISNLPSDTTWQDLKDHFRSSNVNVAFCDVSRQNDGSGYIDLQTKEEVERVLQDMSDTVIRDTKIDLREDGIVHRRAPREKRDRRNDRRDFRRDDRRRDRRDFDRRDRRDHRRDDGRDDRRGDRRDDRDRRNGGRDRRDDRRGGNDRRDDYRRDDRRRDNRRGGRDSHHRESRDDDRDGREDRNHRGGSRSRSRSRQRSRSPNVRRDYSPEPKDIPRPPTGEAPEPISNNESGNGSNLEGSW